MRKTLFTVCVLVSSMVVAQDKAAIKYAKTISKKDLEKHLSILASDEYEGRDTGSRGQKLAAEYIKSHFRNLGLEGPVDGSYAQTVDLTVSEITSAYFRREEEKKENFKDFVYYSRSETSGEEYIKVVFAGEAQELSERSCNGAYVAFAGSLNSFQSSVEKYKKLGAIGFISVLSSENEFKSAVGRFKPFLSQGSMSLEKRDNTSEKLIIASRGLMSWIFEKDLSEIKTGEKASVIFNADYLDKPVDTENLLGYMKGSEKPDELVVITSHYDHIGIVDGEINNGADDDGSGTVTVLEIAEAFAEAKKKNRGPKRSILFMTVTGEEKGLLGSKYYTDTDPVFPLENTVTNLNIDMVGRVDDAHADNPNYIYLIGSDKLSQELHDISEQVNSAYTKLELDYTYNDENDPNRYYYRSDHYNFAKNNIPVIFYFNGVHEDYHQPTDTVEKINFDKMEKIARLIFHTAWEVANRKDRVKVD